MTSPSQLPPLSLDIKGMVWPENRKPMDIIRCADNSINASQQYPSQERGPMGRGGGMGGHPHVCATPSSAW